MAIRFQCARCQQPIEVDDTLAGKMARCPYCQTVVTVPEQSALSDIAPPAARPAGMIPPPLPEISQRRAPSRGVENFALACAALVFILFVVFAGKVMSISASVLSAHGYTATSQPTMAEQMELMEPLQRAAATDPVLGGLFWGLAFFALAGVVSSVIALRRGAGWRAWVALACCTPVLLCNCCNVFANIAGAAAL